MKPDFWDYLQQLVETSQIAVDRPKGSTHQRYPDSIYPVGYGDLEGTISIDLGGVDIWIGTLAEKKVVGALCSVDLLKRDTELKIIYDSSEAEIQSILKLVNGDKMRAIYIKRELLK